MLGLRPYKACDAETVVSWVGDECAFRKWCADRYESYPITAEDMNRHYDAQRDSDSFFEFTAFDDSGIVGHLTMRYTDDNKKVLRLGFVIVDDKKRGCGYGREMLELAAKLGFEIMRAQKLTLGVFENNESAYRCYKAAGFRDVTSDEPEYYEIGGERWKCLELELAR